MTSTLNRATTFDRLTGAATSTHDRTPGVAAETAGEVEIEVALVASVRDEFADAVSRLWLAPRLYGWPQ
jgi:hypothetical protein